MEQKQSWSWETLMRIGFFLLLLYVFFIAIGLMGTAFKLLGTGTAEALITATSNPFTGLMIGILSTAIVQSSSVTTSMVVGLVSGGGLNIANAVPIIMGANIGTSVTNVIVSIGHIRQSKEFERAFAGATVHDLFNLMTVAILLPLELATGYLEKVGGLLAHFFTGAESVAFHSPLKLIVKPATGLIKSFFTQSLDIPDFAAGIIMVVLAFILLFSALVLIVRTMKALMLHRLEVAIDRMFGAKPIFAILAGAVITATIQSSSITTSLLVPLIGAGAMSLEAAFPITIGANIGTTITALLASLAGDVNGLAIAFVHLMFNLSGMMIIYVYEPIRRIPIKAARMMAHLAVINKKFAIAFILGMFYLLPLAGFAISEWIMN